MTNIRLAIEDDFDAVWAIFQEVIKTGRLFVFHPDTPKARLSEIWFGQHMLTYIAEVEGQICGSYFLKPNHVDLGNHVANAGYMVDPAFRGRGIGKLMAEHSIATAKQKGFHAMQFNMVVSTNTAALSLWHTLGFEIIGTIPDGFRDLSGNFIDSHIMYKKL